MLRLLILSLAILLALCPLALAEDDVYLFGNGTPAPDADIAAPAEPTPTPDPSAYTERDGSVVLTLTFTGDVTIGGDRRKSGKSIFDKELDKQGGDYGFLFRNVRELLAQDDMTLVNFEGTLTTAKSSAIPSSKRDNQFLFSAPPEYVEMLKLGNIEAVSLENNHVNDYGEDGNLETRQTLSSAGIVYSAEDEMGVYSVKGVDIALLSYLTIDRYPAVFEEIPPQIAAAKEKYPLVIVSFHWGNELDYKPTANQEKMAKLAVDAGADLVIGHHSHRINPIELYKGKYICYSLGNFSFAGNSKPSDMSTFIFQTRFRVKNGEATPEGFIIIPCRISSRADKNDFAPTPYTKNENIQSLLTVLKRNGAALDSPVAEYPLVWNN